MTTLSWFVSARRWENRKSFSSFCWKEGIREVVCFRTAQLVSGHISKFRVCDGTPLHSFWQKKVELTRKADENGTLLYLFFFLIIKCRQIVCYEVLINSWWVIQLSFCFDFDLKFETFNKLVKTPFDTYPVWIDRRAKIVVVAVEVMQLTSSSWKAIVRVG